MRSLPIKLEHAQLTYKVGGSAQLMFGGQVTRLMVILQETSSYNNGDQKVME
jgi:hypothetical protein